LENELIKLKGTIDGVKIYLSDTADISDIINSLYEKLRQFRKFFGDGHCNIYFVGRELDTSDKMRLDAVASAMLPESTVNYGERKRIRTEQYIEQTIELPKDLSEAEKEPEQTEDNPLKEITQIKEVVTTNFKSSRARFYEGVVRSGKTVESDGHLILVGNVEEGGKLIAVGNVIVMGSIYGSVEAGCMGNDNAYVIALDLKPTDIRISKVHKIFEKGDEYDTEFASNRKKAYLINNQIFLEDFLVDI
jgi:septum site-determining protein MinC